MFAAAQVLDVVVHGPQVGAVAPVAQLEVLVCVMEPVCPVGQERVCVWGEVGSGVQVGGVTVRVAEQEEEPPGLETFMV